MYQIIFGRSAEKDLEQLPLKETKRISKVIDELAKEPRPIGSKKLKGTDRNLWRVRIGDYRVVYNINDTIKIVDIRKVGHRKDIYE